MKLKKQLLYLGILCQSVSSFANENVLSIDAKNVFDENGSINIVCAQICSSQNQMEKLLKVFNTFPSLDQRFNLVYQGAISDSFTLRDYINEMQISQGTISDLFTLKEYTNEMRISSSTVNSLILGNNEVTPMDGSLWCDGPADDCEEWRSNPDVARVIQHLSENPVTLTIDQEYIDGNNNARRLAISTLVATHIGRIASYLGAVLHEVIGSLSGLILNEILTSTSWYHTDLEIGDQITYGFSSNGPVAVITRNGSSGNDGGGNNGGGNDGGSNDGGSNDDGLVLVRKCIVGCVTINPYQVIEPIKYSISTMISHEKWGVLGNCPGGTVGQYTCWYEPQ